MSESGRLVDWLSGVLDWTCRRNTGLVHSYGACTGFEGRVWARWVRSLEIYPGIDMSTYWFWYIFWSMELRNVPHPVCLFVCLFVSLQNYPHINRIGLVLIWFDLICVSTCLLCLEYTDNHKEQDVVANVGRLRWWLILSRVYLYWFGNGHCHLYPVKYSNFICL